MALLTGKKVWDFVEESSVWTPGYPTPFRRTLNPTHTYAYIEIWVDLKISRN